MKRLTKGEAMELCRKQARAYTRSCDPEAYRAIEAAQDALAFLTESGRKVFTSKEVDILLDW